MVPGTIDPASPVAGNSIDPFMTLVVTLSSASLPPMAWTYLSSTSSTVGSEADAAFPCWACPCWPAAPAFETSSDRAPRPTLGASAIRRSARINSARLIGRLLSGSKLCLQVAADIKYHTILERGRLARMFFSYRQALNQGDGGSLCLLGRSRANHTTRTDEHQAGKPRHS